MAILKTHRDQIKQALCDELTRQSNTAVDGFGSALHFGGDDWWIEGNIDADALADAVLRSIVDGPKAQS